MTATRFMLAVLLAGACSPDSPDNAQTHTVEVTVRVPEGTPPVFLTGNLAELGPWDPAAYEMSGFGTRRTATVAVDDGYAFEYKYTLGSWDREGLAPTGSVMPNFRTVVETDVALEDTIAQFRRDAADVLADTAGSGMKGRLVVWQEVASVHLDRTRHVGIWLPPGYDEDADRRYKVIYMHDGQNLFDPRITSGGIDWGVDEAMIRGAESGAFEPAIVVAIWNSADRRPEYSPWHRGADYARFLVEELRPRVDAEFRTLTGPEHTSTMGSSMGGLISYYLVKEHPDVFGACGCVSSHFVLSEQAANRAMGQAGGDAVPYIIRDIEAGDRLPEGTRYFFDYGTEGLDARYGPPHDAIREWLAAQGLSADEDYRVREYAGADHNEASWRARVEDQLAWLLAVR